MTCRWVTDSRLTTFGRRLVITSAVFGLTTVGSAGLALADSGQIGISPPGKVVQKAPTAVSVTFPEPLRSGGARMRVLTQDGDVGTGKITTSARTLRREVRLGAPNGEYKVEWTVVSAKGRKMTGSFAFTAAAGNGPAPRTSPVPSPAVPSPAVPSPAVPSPAVPNPPVPSPPVPSPSVPSPRVSPEASPSVSPSGVVAASPVPAVTATPGWIAGSDPLWTSSPTAAPALAAGGSGTDGEVSTGLTAVPLTVGGLLVLAAGLVSLINRRPRLRH